MKEMFIILAKSLSEETILEKLQDSLTEYRLTKSDKERSQVVMYSQMFTLKVTTEKECIFETIKDMDQAEAGMKLLKTKTN